MVEECRPEAGKGQTMPLERDVDARLARRSLAGFACNQGFVYSLFYLGSNQAFHAGSFAFERAELFGTLAFMVASFAFLLLAPIRVRDAALARPLLGCYAALLVVGSFVPLFAGPSSRRSWRWNACFWACLQAACWRRGAARWGPFPLRMRCRRCS